MALKNGIQFFKQSWTPVFTGVTKHEGPGWLILRIARLRDSALLQGALDTPQNVNEYP
jgi:hypothetical protein